jgi:hypothetical protein
MIDIGTITMLDDTDQTDEIDHLMPVPVLPFLDIMFILIGIFILLVMMRPNVIHHAPAPPFDYLLLCQHRDVIAVYSEPQQAPHRYTVSEFTTLFHDIAALHRSDTHHLGFAFTADCIPTQRTLNTALNQYHTLLSKTHDEGAVRPAWRLTYYPLSADPENIAIFVQQWQQNRFIFE